MRFKFWIVPAGAAPPEITHWKYEPVRVPTLFDQSAIARFAGCEGFLGPLAFGDVFVRHDDPNGSIPRKAGDAAEKVPLAEVAG